MKKLLLICAFSILTACSGGSNSSHNTLSSYDPCSIKSACTDMELISNDEVIQLVKDSDYASAPKVGAQIISDVTRTERTLNKDKDGKLVSQLCKVSYQLEKTLIMLTDEFLYSKEKKSNFKVEPADLCGEVSNDYDDEIIVKEFAVKLDHLKNLPKDQKSYLLKFKGEQVLRQEVSSKDSKSGSLTMHKLSSNHFTSQIVNHNFLEVNGQKSEDATVLKEVKFDANLAGLDLTSINTSEIEDRSGENNKDDFKRAIKK